MKFTVTLQLPDYVAGDTGYGECWEFHVDADNATQAIRRAQQIATDKAYKERRVSIVEDAHDFAPVSCYMGHLKNLSSEYFASLSGVCSRCEGSGEEPGARYAGATTIAICSKCYGKGTQSP